MEPTGNPGGQSDEAYALLKGTVHTSIKWLCIVVLVVSGVLSVMYHVLVTHIVVSILACVGIHL